MSRVVVVGTGLAGFRTGRSLRDAGFDGSITLIGDERHLPYDRPPLSKQLLAGTFTPEQCRLTGAVDDLTWRLGDSVVGLNTMDRTVLLADGTREPYDHLVIATGRRARRWPGAVPAAGVHTLRSLDDVAAFAEDLRTATDVVIIGAGFIGCEVAATLRKRGVGVHVVDVSDFPMPVIGVHAGRLARELHERNGVQWRLGHGVAAIEGEERPTGVRLDDGEILRADVVLVCIGSQPNTEWLAGSEVAPERGVVVVDGTCRVLDSSGVPLHGVWAAGDIAAWQHPHSDGHVCVEHWSNARDMADCVAANITAPAGGEQRQLSSVPAFWSDQYDVKIKSVGYLGGADELVVIEQDPARPSVLIEARRGGQPIGAVGFNMNKAVLGYQRALRPVPV